MNKKKIVGAVLILASVGIIVFAITTRKSKSKIVQMPIFKNGDVFFNSTIPEAGSFIWGFKDGKWYVIEDVDFELMKSDGLFAKSNSKEAFLKYPKADWPNDWNPQIAFQNLGKYFV